METVLNKYRVVIEEMQSELHDVHGRKLAADERIMKIERDLEESQISLREKNFELTKLKGRDNFLILYMKRKRINKERRW